MRQSGPVDRSVGLRPHDHVCWIHDGADAWLNLVMPYLHEGAGADERLLYVADKDRDGLIEDLAPLPGRDALLDTGQLCIMPVAEAYGPVAQFSADRQVRTYRALARDAVDAGFRGLRLAAEVSTMATAMPQIGTFTRYELMLDEMICDAPLVCLCGYDRQKVRGHDSAVLCFVHPLRHPAAGTAQEGIHAASDGWHLAGELDLRTAYPLDLALSSLPMTGDVHLHLENLRYCDAASIRTLVRQAARRHPAGRLVLHDPPPLFRWVLQTGWPGEVPGLEVRGR